jgi:hypothetical protein
MKSASSWGKRRGGEAPHVHRDRFFAGERRDHAVLGAVLGGGADLGDLGEFLDVRQEALGVRLADAAGDRAVVRQGVLEREADHRVGGVVVAERGEMTGQRRVGIAAVEVVGVDDGERRRDDVLGAEDGVGRAPRLFAAGGHGEPRWELIQRLEGEVDRDAAGELGGDALAEILLEVRTDDEDDLAEACADGVEDGVVEDGLAGRTHRVNLLEAAVAATHAGGEDEEGGLHVRGLS